MRKKLLRILKPTVAVFLAIALVLSYLPENIALAFINDFSSTQIFHNDEREIAEGVVLNQWIGANSSGKNKVGKTITFNPASSDAMIYAAYGNSVASRVTLSNLSKREEEQGLSIIGGINGDFYYVDTGIPIGLLVQNRRLISYSNTDWNAVGFNADGSVVIDKPNIEMSFTTGGNTHVFRNLNKSQNDWGPYLYTSDFGPNTGSKVPSLEIVLDITEGDLRIGEQVKAVVSGIKLNAQSTPIGPNQLVLSARNHKSGYSVLGNFRMGDELVFNFKDVENKWADVQQAVGGDTILINNGAIASGLSTSDYAPYSAVGVKSNGEVVFFQVDGRSTASQGLSSAEMAQFLHKLGCVKALKLDGGGSSAIIGRMPGYNSPQLLNSPSDGRERANSNGLILISKQSVAIKEGTAVKSDKAEKLHIYPKVVYALPGSSVKLSVLATDEHYLPAKVPEQINWATGTGTIDSKGNLSIGDKTGNYSVLAVSGLTGASATVKVLDQVTSIAPSKTMLTMLPGDKVDLSCEAYYKGIKVNSHDTSFTWQVEGNIGSITPEGVFTLTATDASQGRIKVQYGDTASYINVVVPSANLDAIEDFEGNMKWGASTVRSRSGNVSLIEDADLARSGKGLLKLDYDFTLDSGVEAGVAGVYAYMTAPGSNAKIETPVPGNPSAIGMWVYGDNSKAWLRANVRDSSGQTFYIDFTPDYNPVSGIGGINWTGWNYVEAKIPDNRKGPFVLETPIRVMCSRDEMRTKGTLYFDQIRAIYGEGSSDRQTTAKITSPQDGASLKTGTVAFNAEIIKGSNVTGLDQSSIKAMLDGLQLEDLIIEGDSNLAIKGELGSALPLADGYHTLTLEYADLAGNKGVKTVRFTVDTGAPQVWATTHPTVFEGGNFDTTIEIKNPKNLKKVYIDIKYDPDKVAPVDQDGNTVGIQTLLEPWAKKGKIIGHRVDAQNGRIIYEIDNLTNLSNGELAKLATITFKAKETMTDSTSIELTVGAMIVEGNPRSQRFSLPKMNVTVDYPLILEAKNLNQGDTSTITVTDKDGNPVEGAGIYINDISYAFWTTDEKGQVVTNALTLTMKKGEPLKIRARKDGLLSKPLVLVE